MEPGPRGPEPEWQWPREMASMAAGGGEEVCSPSSEHHRQGTFSGPQTTSPSTLRAFAPQKRPLHARSTLSDRFHRQARGRSNVASRQRSHSPHRPASAAADGQAARAHAITGPISKPAATPKSPTPVWGRLGVVPSTLLVGHHIQGCVGRHTSLRQGFGKAVREIKKNKCSVPVLYGAMDHGRWKSGKEKLGKCLESPVDQLRCW